MDLDQTVLISGIGRWRMSTVLKRLTKDGDGNSTQIGESRDRRMENGKIGSGSAVDRVEEVSDS